MLKCLKNYYLNNTPLFISLLLSFGILMLYWIASPQMIFERFYDAIDYLDYAYSYKISYLRFFNDYRAPLYPLFLYLQGITDGTQLWFFNYLTQILLVLSSITFSWETIKKVTANKKLRTVTIILISLGFDVLWMTKTALTESLTMFFLALSLLCFLHLIEKPSIIKSVLTGTIFIGLYLTRPFNLYLFIPLIFYWIISDLVFKKLGGRNILYYLLLFGVIFSSYLTYSFANYSRHKYFGVSIEGGANLLAKIAEHPQLLPNKSDKYPEVLEKASTCRLNKEDYFTCQYSLVPHVNESDDIFKGSIGWERNDSFVKQVEAFSMSVIMNNFPQYVYLQLVPISASLLELYGNLPGEGEIYWTGVSKNSPIAFLFAPFGMYLQAVHIFFAINIFVFSPIFFIILIIKNKIKQKQEDINLGILYTVIVYYVLLTGLVAAGDYGRMVTPALPIIYTLSCIVFYNLIKILAKNRRLKLENRS